MERSQVPEFHFIAPIANVASILHHGILSHNRAALLQHFDISMQKIQELRGKKRVPGRPSLARLRESLLQWQKQNDGKETTAACRNLRPACRSECP
jgi:hypothetical protein